MNGYILESKTILESEIWYKPPIYFKVWHYLLLKANYKDSGNLKRGQLFTTIDELREACTYKQGYRSVRPSRKEIWSVLEWLRSPHEGNNEGNTKETMIETTKVTHGMVITVCNYNVYQSPSFYEGNNEGNNERNTKGTMKGTEGEQYYKEYKNNNKKNKKLERDKREIENDLSGNDFLVAHSRDRLPEETISEKEFSEMRDDCHNRYIARLKELGYPLPPKVRA